MSRRPASVPEDETLGSLGRGLTVVEWMSRSRAPIGARELGARLDISRSAAQRYLATLRSKGWVEKDREDKYRLTLSRALAPTPVADGSPDWLSRLKGWREEEGRAGHRRQEEVESRVSDLLARTTAEAFLTTAPETAHYLTGVYNPVRRLIPERPAMVLWNRERPPVLIVGAIEAALLEGRSAISDVRYYSGGMETIARELRRALEDAGLLTATVGTEMMAMPASLHQALLAAAPDLNLIDASAELGELRAIKSDAEIQILAAAAQATDHAEWSALRSFRLGTTELQMGVMLRQGLISAGAETVAFLTLGGSGRGVGAHAVPTEAVVQPGELIRFDLGGVFDGWCTDIAKTAVIGEPNAEQRRVYRELRQILDRHSARLRPGAVAADLYRAVADDFVEAGLELRGPHVGHGIGLSVHEWPLLSPDSTAVLQAGMVLCAELIHVHEGRERYHLEEIVRVRDEGAQVISRTDQSDAEIPILG